MTLGDTYQEDNITSPLETFEWDNFWWEHTEDENAKRVLLIGDSISGNYRWRMVDILQGEIHPDRFGTSKGIDNPYLLSSLELFAKQSPKYDVIQVNNGLHGFHLSAEQYKEHYRKFLKGVQKIFPDTPIIIALTTPVRNKENFEELGERNAEVLKRNQAASELAEELGLPVNDLYSVLIDHPEVCGDGVHQTEEGNMLMAEKIVEVIRQYIK